MEQNLLLHPIATTVVVQSHPREVFGSDDKFYSLPFFSPLALPNFPIFH